MSPSQGHLSWILTLVNSLLRHAVIPEHVTAWYLGPWNQKAYKDTSVATPVANEGMQRELK